MASNGDSVGDSGMPLPAPFSLSGIDLWDDGLSPCIGVWENRSKG